MRDFGLVVTITDNFSDEKKLGEGEFGDVYEGVIEDTENQKQVRVTVKRVKPSIRFQGDETEYLTSILREVHVFGRFSHPNIIRLLCFTSTSAGTAQEVCLVYDLDQHVSLDKMLVDTEQIQDILGEVRVRIAAGVLRVINYLHCHCHDPWGPVFHRDVKSVNIVPGYMCPCTLRWENRPASRKTGLEMPCYPLSDLLWVQIAQSYPHRLRSCVDFSRPVEEVECRCLQKSTFTQDSHDRGFKT